VASGALGLFFAIDESFELVTAFLADVLEDRHAVTPDVSLLKSICGEFANQKFDGWNR
jgi:hypothetical protein